MFRTIHLALAFSVAVASAMFSAAFAQDRPEPPEVLVDAPPVPVNPALVAKSSYWLGVECEPAAAPLRAQLKLKEGQGLLVRHVMPDSPAAKAGIQANDVLLSFNDARLGEVADLSRAVSDAGEQASTVRLIRAGEEQELQVAPQKRPSFEAVERDVNANGPLRKWVPFEPGEEPWRMLFVRPGMVGPFGLAPAELPQDSSLTITREGDAPAKVVYHKGDETWEATAEKLDELPEEVRPFARRALGVANQWEVEVRGPDGAMIRKALQGLPGFAPPDPNLRVEKLRLFEKTQKKPGETKDAPPDAPQAETTESAVGELRRAVQELRQELQKLRQERAEGNR
jgi:membrane-associated protease RseP (regulator of RpoE activity)